MKRVRRLPALRVLGAIALALLLAVPTVPALAQYYGYPYGGYGSGYGYGTYSNPYSYYGGYSPYSYYGGYSPYSYYGGYYGGYGRLNPYGPYGNYYLGPIDFYGTGAGSYGYYGDNYLYGNPYGYYGNPYNPYGQGCAAVGANQVGIYDGPPGYYQPATISVRVGDTVNWTNCGPTNQHTSTSSSGLWDSGTLSRGQSFSFRFTNTGTFPYRCSLHGHTGTVVVS
jgi:plastocyanin